MIGNTNKQYIASLKKSPYHWAFCVSKANNVHDLSDKEVKEVAEVANKIQDHEIEVQDIEKRSEKIDRVDSFIKKLSKLDEDEERFEAFRSVTEKLVNTHYPQYKAEDDDKLLTEISEENVKEENENEDSDDSSDDGSFPSGEVFNRYAEEGRLHKVMNAVHHEEFISLFRLDRYETEITIEDNQHDTELWNALLFAIHKERMDVIKFLMEANLNTRLALTNPEKRVDEYDDEDLIEITPDDELYGVKVAIGTRNFKVFKYVWDNNRDVWTEEHFLDLIDYLEEVEWDEGLKCLLESHASHEIYISCTLDNKIFDKLLQIALKDRKDNKKKPGDLMSILTKSPYWINMAITESKDLQDEIAEAKTNIQDNELNILILRNEVDKYETLIKKSGDQKFVQSLRQYQAFQEAHFRVQIDEAIKKVIAKKDNDIQLFVDNPKLAHWNLHTHLKFDLQKYPKYIHNINWTFPSLLLLWENIECFDTVVAKYRPMLGMIFRDEEQIEGEDDIQRSLLQLLWELSQDIVMFNCLENHPSMFTFKTLYNLVKHVISNGKPQHARILNSKAVKSYFTFLSPESKRKFIEELIDWAEDDKMKEVVGVILWNPTYEEFFIFANEDLHAEMKGKSIDLFNSSKGGSKHEHSSGEASEADDSSEDDDSNDEDQSEKEDEDEDENSEDEDENSEDNEENSNEESD